MFEDILGTGKKEQQVDIDKYNDEPICPKCGSTNIYKRGQGFFSVGPVYIQPMKCKDCSNEWKEVRSSTTQVIDIR